MNYILPQPHKCLKCGYEAEYSPHIQHPAPVTENFTGCPKCWEEFLRKNIGDMKCTVDFGKGSQYENTKAI